MQNNKQNKVVKQLIIAFIIVTVINALILFSTVASFRTKLLSASSDEEQVRVYLYVPEEITPDEEKVEVRLYVPEEEYEAVSKKDSN